ncbi:hypothetical protein [Angustibacter aerolatus]
MPIDDDRDGQARTTHTLQDLLVELYHQHRGASVETTRAALVEGIAARGLPEQPEPWLDSTATDLAGGRRVLLSSLEASGDVPRDPSEPS